MRKPRLIASALLFLGKQNAILHVVLVAALAATVPRLRWRMGVALAAAAAVAVGVVLILVGSLEPVLRATAIAGAMRGLPNLIALLGILDGLGPRAFALDMTAVALALVPLLAPGVRRLFSPLTPREIRLLATCGLIVGHAAHDHARQYFERMAPRMIAEVIARMARDDDDPEGGSKPS